MHMYISHYLSLNIQSTFPKNKTILHTTLVQVQKSDYLTGINLNTINLQNLMKNNYMFTDHRHCNFYNNILYT